MARMPEKHDLNLDTLGGAMQDLAGKPQAVAIVLAIEPDQEPGSVHFTVFIPDTMPQQDGMRWIGECARSFGYAPKCSNCEQLQDRLDDLLDSHKRTVAEACNPPAADDRLHCHCVPALRTEVAELTDKLKRYEHIKFKDDRTIGALNESRNALIEEVAQLRAQLQHVASS